ncbi:MAG TPA: hypothetical protein PKD20_04575 [Candidatus Saccharibacteria bacterium]|nr:hypothetical protein [Candidatus Saccharibacteria bacterium]HMT56122.1 hypothetical protein [Candidatus Saccharibacteria bacterium]
MPELSTLISQIKKLHSTLLFVADKTFYWSPKDATIHFDKNASGNEAGWSLIHETGHALLEHTRYYSDIELVQMELAAWERAKEVASLLNVSIEEDHIQDCIDSYRDWLYKRSLCPHCDLCGVQIDKSVYTCVFCLQEWRVTNERFCRPYRKTV